MACSAADFLGPFYCLIDFIRSRLGRERGRRDERDTRNNNIITYYRRLSDC